MRSLERARESWQELQHYKNLRELKDAVRLESNSSAATLGLRSACWKAFLLFESLDVTEWQRTLTASRSAYNSLRSHFFRYIENPDEVGSKSDPLNQDDEMHKDEELRAEILQDVERIGIPDSSYFRDRERQRMLLDILFIFCKLNPDVGYRQGMHEIAAPILYAVESDAVDIGGMSKVLGDDSAIVTVFDSEHIEHDAYAITGQVLQNAKAFYLSDGPISIATRSRHIFNELLPQVDPELVKHLESLDIVPQVFLIRWIRLLFGREFEFDAVLSLWDVIFAEDTSLELVDHICLAMLLRIRWHLLGADYNNALQLLLRYPELDKDFPAQTIGLDALYLRTHMNSEGASYLVLKYTGRPLVLGRSTTPPALQRNITTFAGRHTNHVERKTGLSPPRTPRQSRNIEAMLQNTAKNIYARSEKLGIGKAVRTAVEEVHKKAQEIRDSQAPLSSSQQRSGEVQVLDRLRMLELRNKQLSKLLAGAVDELWEYQRLIAEADHAEANQSVEKLSTAVAKVQFVQVCLDEPTLSLPEDGQSEEASSALSEQIPETHLTGATTIDPGDEELAKDPIQPTPHIGSTTGGLADPSTFDDFDEPSIIFDREPTTVSTPSEKPPVLSGAITNTETDPQSASTLMKYTTSRPPLEQSAFSFMLGQDDGADSPGTSGSPRPSRLRKRPDSNLFGSEQRQPSDHRAEGDPLRDEKSQEAEFDMGSLRRAKGAR